MRNVLRQQRPWPHEAHLSANEIEKLRNLVEARSTEKGAETGEALLVRREATILATVVRHSAELAQRERLGIEADPSLAKEDGCAEAEAHDKSD
jgi:hypothetical protein